MAEVAANWGWYRFVGLLNTQHWNRSLLVYSLGKILMRVGEGERPLAWVVHSEPLPRMSDLVLLCHMIQLENVQYLIFSCKRWGQMMSTFKGWQGVATLIDGNTMESCLEKQKNWTVCRELVVSGSEGSNCNLSSCKIICDLCTCLSFTSLLYPKKEPLRPPPGASSAVVGLGRGCPKRRCKKPMLRTPGSDRRDGG